MQQVALSAARTIVSPWFARPAAISPRKLAAAATVTALVIVILAAVALTGGLPNALNNLLYGVVVIASYEFGWKGGLATAGLIAALFGPYAAAVGIPTDGLQSWALRLSAFAAIGFVVGGLFDRQRARSVELEATVAEVRHRERATILLMARAAEAKDTDTGDHVRRVQHSTERLAQAVGFDADRAAAIGWAAMLHDIGKLHVPDRILVKPGPLTTEEWVTMRNHTIWGERILAGSEGFEVARRIARWHHEDFDGAGYPDGLAGEGIPLEARIVRITDAFDAMTNRRRYSKPKSAEEALAELFRCRGRQFDPALVELMIDLVRAHPGMLRQLDAIRAPEALFHRPDEPVTLVRPAS